MEKLKNNITGNVIAVIISLLTIVSVFGGFISNQAKLEVQLTNIQKELTEINVKLDKENDETKAKLEKKDDEIKALNQRVTILEQKK